MKNAVATASDEGTFTRKPAPAEEPSGLLYYNPPRRERILEWQAKQEFPICPNPDDTDACNVYCNVYKELDLPERVFEHVEEYREQQV